MELIKAMRSKLAAKISQFSPPRLSDFRVRASSFVCNLPCLLKSTSYSEGVLNNSEGGASTLTAVVQWLSIATFEPRLRWCDFRRNYLNEYLTTLMVIRMFCTAHSFFLASFSHTQARSCTKYFRLSGK